MPDLVAGPLQWSMRIDVPRRRFHLERSLHCDDLKVAILHVKLFIFRSEPQMTAQEVAEQFTAAL
ncbi:MAG: hypothetical protein AAF745_17585 [Planctomycetota bacterium]